MRKGGLILGVGGVVAGLAAAALWLARPDPGVEAGATSPLGWTAARHAPSAMPLRPWRGEGGDKPFAVYVADTLPLLDASRAAWETDAVVRAEHVAAIAPREWPLAPGCEGKAKAGVLLIHGLSDTPFSMRDLGDALAAQANACLLVRALLLPGHGSVPGDLMRATADDWKAAVRYGVGSFAGQTDKVHLLGFSLGGALALDLVQNGLPTTPSVASLALLAPAIGADNRFPVHKIPFGFDLFKSVLSLASGFTPKGEWLRLNEDLDFARYESFPLEALRQLMIVMDAVSLSRRPVSQPVFMAFAAEDAAVDSQASLDFFRTYAAHPRSRLLLSVTPGTLAAHPERYGALPREDARITCLQAAGPEAPTIARDASCTPSPNTLAQTCPYGNGPDGCLTGNSHIAIPTAPANPHYGANGDYRNCLGYVSSQDFAQFCACVPPAQRAASALCRDQAAGASFTLRQGEPGETDLTQQGVVMARLGYNPQFNTLRDALLDFLP